MPVYRNLAGDEIARQLALRIRRERLRCGWTLHELASRVGASVSTLSTIENRQAWPAVDLLFQLADAFGMSVDALLVPSGIAHFQVTRRVELNTHPPAPLKMVSRSRRGLTAYHNRLWPLADAFVGKYIEPFEIEIQPLRDRDLRFISHTHEEFVFVLRGQMEVLIKSPHGLQSTKLGAGDGMYFWSYLPHCIRSTTSEPARSVHVLTSLEEAVDSETAEWVSGPVIYMMEAPYKSPGERVAARIVALRKARGMSAMSFAKHINVSIRRLARIERGEGPLSLKLLLHICRTFRRPPDYFLAGASVPPKVHVVDRAQNVRRRANKPVDALRLGACYADSSVRTLSAEFRNRRMFPSLISLNRSRHASSHRTSHHLGQEFVYVLTGEVRLSTRCGDESTEVLLSPGDSCLLDSSIAHSFSAASLSPYGSARAEVLAVRWRPPLLA